jgi:serine/threonine-protein kinase RsbT
MDSETHLQIRSDADIVTARQKGREMALLLNFLGSDVVMLATIISELARNIVEYAQHGELVLSIAQQVGKRGIIIIARDEGPGIPDLELAMKDGYSTGNSLGLGLPGTKRMMDEFEIISEVGVGTTVTAKKWER